MGDVAAALQVYCTAADYVASAGLAEEVQWQRDADFDAFTETDFLREMAWVILCSGFREAAVRRVFDYISLCFCEWESACSIVDMYPACSFAARASFNHGQKIAAIVEAAHRIHEQGFTDVKAAILLNPVEELRRFPYIGPVTVWHLAKNLGMDAPKPDRHLMRISSQLGFSGPNELCDVIAARTGEPVRVVDLIIWRYMADNPRNV